MKRLRKKKVVILTTKVCHIYICKRNLTPDNIWMGDSPNKESLTLSNVISFHPGVSKRDWSEFYIFQVFN